MRFRHRRPLPRVGCTQGNAQVKHLSIHVIVILVRLLTDIAAGAQSAPPLSMVQAIPLPAVEGRIDHLAIDIAGKRLFVAALGSNSLEVIDLVSAKVIKHISSLLEPQGVAYLAEAGLVAVANGGDGTCRLYKADSLQAVASIELGTDADNVRWAPGEQRIYVGFGDGAIAAIDVNSRKRIGTVRLSGHPESFQLEKNGTRICVNVPARQQIALIDRKSLALVDTWKLDGRANFPLALDEEHHRLYVGCRQPAEVLVFDTASGNVMTRFPTVGDTDDLYFEPKHKRLYVSGGAGFVVVHQQQAADQYTEAARVATAAGARTALFVSSLSRLYLAVPHRGAQAAEIRVYEIQN